MGYIHDFERELRTRLDAGDVDGAVKFAKEKALESYRNGVEMGAQADKKDGEKAKRFVKRTATPRTQNAGS